jgi:hypothetical protein
MHHYLLAQITNPAIDPDYGADPSGGGGIALALIMARLFRTLVIVGGLALLLYLAWGGISWITAGGDPQKVDLAKDKLTNAVIGMGVLVAVVAITAFLSYAFGFDLLSPVL